MGTNGAENPIHLVGEEDGVGVGLVNGKQDHEEGVDHSDIAPLVNRIAFSLAKELAGAIRELEHHVSVDARRVGESVERRLDAAGADLADLSRSVGEQRSSTEALLEQLQHLTDSDARLRETQDRQAQELGSLREEAREFSGAVSARLDAAMAAIGESDARQIREQEALQNEVRSSFQPVWERIDNLCRDFSARQEDIAATKTSLNTICSRIDECVGRLDRQAEAVRSLHGVSRQRNAELEHILEGLVRLRAYAQPEMPEGL